MQADGRLVEHEHGIGLGPADLAGQLQTLGFAAGKAGRFLAQSQVAKAQLLQDLQLLADRFHVPAKIDGRVHVHVHQLRQRGRLPRRAGQFYQSGRPGIAGTTAVRAGDVHIRQELHVQAHLAGAVAAGTAQGPGVVGKISGLVAVCLCVRRPRKEPAQVIVDACVGGNGGADVDPDGGRINELDVGDALRVKGADMRRQCLAVDAGFQCRNKALQHQRGLAGAGHAGHDGQPPLGQVYFQRLHRVELRGGKMECSLCKQGVRQCALSPQGVRLSGEEGPDLGRRVRLDGRDGALCDHMAALCPGFRPHFHDPVCFL